MDREIAVIVTDKLAVSAARKGMSPWELAAAMFKHIHELTFTEAQLNDSALFTYLETKDAKSYKIIYKGGLA